MRTAVRSALRSAVRTVVRMILMVEAVRTGVVMAVHAVVLMHVRNRDAGAVRTAVRTAVEEHNGAASGGYRVDLPPRIDSTADPGSVPRSFFFRCSDGARDILRVWGSRTRVGSHTGCHQLSSLPHGCFPTDHPLCLTLSLIRPSLDNSLHLSLRNPGYHYSY